MGLEFTPVFLFLIVAIGIAASMIVGSALLAPKRLTRVKQMPYESGMDPATDARQRFDVRFYLVAIVFLLFDVELLFLYPWAVVFRELKMFGFFEMLIFVALVLVGYFYVYKKGVLDWSGEFSGMRGRDEK